MHPLFRWGQSVLESQHTQSNLVPRDTDPDCKRKKPERSCLLGRGTLRCSAVRFLTACTELHVLEGCVHTAGTKACSAAWPFHLFISMFVRDKLRQR